MTVIQARLFDKFITLHCLLTISDTKRLSAVSIHYRNNVNRSTYCIPFLLSCTVEFRTNASEYKPNSVSLSLRQAYPWHCTAIQRSLYPCIHTHIESSARSARQQQLPSRYNTERARQRVIGHMYAKTVRTSSPQSPAKITRLPSVTIYCTTRCGD